MQITVGAYLQSIRKEQNLSLDQVSLSTRIRIPYLRALEEDEPDLLPSKVQARGYLRLYADYLNIDEQPLLDAWPDKPLVFPETDEPIETNSSDPDMISPEPATPIQVDKIEISIPPDLIPDSEDNFTNDSEPVEMDSAQNIEEAPNAQKIFRDIGQQLRKQRESISVTIEDVERFTRLRGHYIRALEEGKLEDLPSLVQGRGMLSNYASFLNMDTEALLNQFADALQTRRIELTAPVQNSEIKKKSKTLRKLVPPPGWKKILTPDLLTGSALFVVLLVFIIWGSTRISSLRKGSTEPTAPSISDVLINPEMTANPGEDLALTGQPSIEVTPGGNVSGEIVTGGDLLTPSGEDITLTDETIPAGSSPVQVIVVVNQRIWMRVTVDNKVEFEGRAAPGNAYPFNGQERIELTAASGNAIEVIYNQKNLGVMGSAGEVVRLIFTQTESVIPTAMFTPTPTITLQPTLTLQPTQTLTLTAPVITITPSITPLIP